MQIFLNSICLLLYKQYIIHILSLLSVFVRSVQMLINALLQEHGVWLIVHQSIALEPKEMIFLTSGQFHEPPEFGRSNSAFTYMKSASSIIFNQSSNE